MALATTSLDLYPHLARLLGIPDGLAVRKLVLSLGVDETPILTLETIAGRSGEVEKQEYDLRPVGYGEAMAGMVVDSMVRATDGTEATATART